MPKDRMVTVCSECQRACCWHGTFMCDNAERASTIDLPAPKLDELGLEHPSHYGRERLRQITGRDE